MKKTTTYLVLVCLYVLGSKTGFAQKKLDDYFDHLFKNKKFMGSVAVLHNDSVFYAKSVGHLASDSKQLINRNTKFRIGSITKTFTAALVLKAMEEQKLKLNEKLALYYPTIENASKITVEQLLRHRSGIFNFTDGADARVWEQKFHTEPELLDYLTKGKSVFEPGTEYQYSNSNYVLLSFILRKIYKKTFAEILEEKICKPLGLKNTYYTFEVDSARNEALSYNIQDTYVKNAAVNFSNHPGGGGMVSTAIDVNRFLFALFNEKLISKQSLEMMLPLNKGEYGMGIIKMYTDSPAGYKHGGRVENYISDYWYFPKENLGIVTLSSAINIDMDMINMALLRYAFGTQPSSPNFEAISGISVAEFAKIKGTYINSRKNNTVTISSNGEHMVFQGSGVGQDYIDFEYTGNHTFKYEEIVLKFLPQKKEMHLKQGDISEVYQMKK